MISASNMETDQPRSRMKPQDDGATGRTLRNRSKIRATRERIPQKRQALQDMARPLKHWLIKHRHNPYPTKTEKIDLALGSRMTLVQVSNWFANARRRLKNTVREANLSWAKRIQLYNSNVVGNAELLSIHSEDSIWNSTEETEEALGTTRLPVTTPTSTANEDHSYSVPDSCCVLGKRHHHHQGPGPEVSAKRRRCHEDDTGSGRQSPDSTFLKESEEGRGREMSPIACRLSQKYKTHILQRYLHDVCSNGEGSRVESNGHQVQMEDREERRQRRRKNPNPKPTPGHPLRTVRGIPQADQLHVTAKRKHRPQPPTGRYLKELDAAMALATLARVARSSSMTTVHQENRFVPSV